jgi:hypothetical protein
MTSGGKVFCVPASEDNLEFRGPCRAPGPRHAWRKTTGAPFVTYIITTLKLGKFFQEVGRPIGNTDQPVSAEDIADFLSRYGSAAGKYGYWNATPEENAAVGIYL